jgi:ubiquinone/menaquinone biosynthesis C-methylase UbiE
LGTQQDKSAEIATGRNVPDIGWLERNTALDRINRKRLEKAGMLPARGLKIPDAGCGPGNFGLVLAREGGEVLGVDIASEAVVIANDRAIREKLGFSAQVADIEKLPYPDNTFDVCFCGWVIHHFPDIRTPISELRRVLKTGGKLTLLEPNESSPAVRMSRLAENMPVLRGMVLKAGWDTPNRATHHRGEYLEAMRSAGFTRIRFSTCTFGEDEHPRVEGNVLRTWSLIGLFRMRAMLFASTAIPPFSRFAGTELIISGMK